MNSGKVLNCNGKILDLSVPAVMGILNVTPDSFSDGGKFVTAGQQLKHAERMLGEGASVIDIGAVSTRPGAREVSPAVELERLLPAVESVRQSFPEAIISVDTFRPETAKVAVEAGADMINDIYGGRFDNNMMRTVASLHVPYIIMHMKGDPLDMQNDPQYSDVLAEITYFFEKQVAEARSCGIQGIVIDPGFGFGKTIEHNYRLLSRLDALLWFGLPLMVGVSRKSMTYRVLGGGPDGMLAATSVLQTLALSRGADILRTHDVKEAVDAVRLMETLKKYSIN